MTMSCNITDEIPVTSGGVTHAELTSYSTITLSPAHPSILTLSPPNCLHYLLVFFCCCQLFSFIYLGSFYFLKLLIGLTDSRAFRKCFGATQCTLSLPIALSLYLSRSLWHFWGDDELFFPVNVFTFQVLPLWLTAWLAGWLPDKLTEGRGDGRTDWLLPACLTGWLTERLSAYIMHGRTLGRHKHWHSHDVCLSKKTRMRMRLWLWLRLRLGLGTGTASWRSPFWVASSNVSPPAPSTCPPLCESCQLKSLSRVFSSCEREKQRL